MFLTNSMRWIVSAGSAISPLSASSAAPDAYNSASLWRPDYIFSIAATSAPFAVAFAGSFAR